MRTLYGWNDTKRRTIAPLWIIVWAVFAAISIAVVGAGPAKAIR